MKKISLIIVAVVVFTGIFPLENSRIRLQSQSVLNGSLPDAWNFLSDLSLAHQYWPGALTTDVMDIKQDAEGPARTLLLENGEALQERVIEWDEGAGYVLAWDKSSNTWSLHDVEIRYRIEADNELGKKSDLSVTMTLRPRFGWLGRWLLSDYLAKYWQAQLDQLADGIQFFYDNQFSAESALNQ